MRTPGSVACFCFSVVIVSALLALPAAGQDVTGEWDLTTPHPCPLVKFRVVKTGEAVVWTTDYYRGFRNPEPHLDAKIKRRGRNIEMTMDSQGLETVTPYLKLYKYTEELTEVTEPVRGTLRGTIAGDRIKATIVLAEGEKKESGKCEFTRSAGWPR
jgi:hypothetical protein